MKRLLFTILFFTAAANAQDLPVLSPNATLVNKVRFTDARYDRDSMGYGFLLKYQNDTFAVTAKHLLQLSRPAAMTTLSFERFVKRWDLYIPGQPGQVETFRLINENSAETLEGDAPYVYDFLVFSLKNNHSKAQPLEPRLSPLEPGEPLFVLGPAGTRTVRFTYYRTAGQHLILEGDAGDAASWTGAPVVDAQGLVAGLVSNTTTDPSTGKKYFSPCGLERLLDLLKTEKKE